MTATTTLEVIVDAMAPEELPRDEGVDVFIHDSGYAVTLCGSASDLRRFLAAYWGDDEWADETVAKAEVIG